VLRRGLHEVLTWVVESSARVGEQIHADFFDPAQPVAAAASAEQSQSQTLESAS
jgi:hypothetical protein